MKASTDVRSPRRWVLTFAVLFGVITTAHAGALSVQDAVQLPIKPEAAWALVGAFSGLDRWHPAIQSSDVQGTGQQSGDTRMLNLANGATIKEQLMGYHGSSMSYRYQILQSSLPVKGYVSTISVEPAGDGQSKVVWSSTFKADGVSDNKARQTIDGIYQAGLDFLAELYK